MSGRLEAWGVRLLLEQGWSFYREDRYADALRVAEKAREEAKRIEDIGLEVRAARQEGAALKLLGRDGEALARSSWILGVAEDPAHRATVADEHVAYEVVTAFLSWADCALSLPALQVDKLFGVLDAGERFARTLGRPTWRAGLLQMRARVLGALGRGDEAIGCAEEGLALALRDRTAPGGTLGSHRSSLGKLLRDAGRHDEARPLYQAVHNDPESQPYDRFGALRGLLRCALNARDLPAARAFAEEAVRLAEPMGDDALSGALEDLTIACRAQGDLPAARATSARHVEVARRHGGVEHLFSAYVRATEVALAERAAARARAFLDEAQPHAEALDRARNRHYYRADLDRLRADLAELETVPNPQ